MIFNYLVILFWAIFIVYWAISAIGVKKNIGGSTWVRGALLRIAAFIALAFILRFYAGPDYFYSSSVIASTIGAILCGAGIAFAIWARRHLGRNWSGTPRIKEGHELVTSGPYRFVRHPIYTGILLAIFGSALVAGPIWLVTFVLFSIMFIWRIKIEEGYMLKLFPEAYPEYRKRTKALIPFIW